MFRNFILKSKIIKIFRIWVLFFFIFVNCFTFSTSFSRNDQITNTVEQPGLTTVIIAKSSNNTFNSQILFYNFNTTTYDLGQTINFEFIFSNWTSISSNITNPNLTLELYSSSNALLKSFPVDYNTTDKIITINTLPIGINIVKLYFNSTFIMQSNNNYLFQVDCKLIINNFKGSAWFYAIDSNQNSPDTMKWISLKDSGSNILFWLNLNKNGTYFFNLEIFSAINPEIMKGITITSKNNPSQRIQLNTSGLIFPTVKFYLSLNSSQLGLWKFQYLENLAFKGFSYRFSLSDSFYNEIPFYFPFSNQSAPSFQTRLTNNNNNNYNFPLTFSLAISNQSIFVAIATLIFFKKAKFTKK